MDTQFLQAINAINLVGKNSVVMKKINPVMPESIDLCTNTLPGRDLVIKCRVLIRT